MHRAARFALAACLTLSASVASAQQDTRPDGGDTPAPPAETPRTPPLALDKLLNPRTGTPSSAESVRPGGKDRETWQKQFAEANAEVAQLRARVEESQRKMRNAAGDTAYSYSPAGGGETYDPDVLKTRAQLQRDRQSLQAAERRLRDLKVEASLAGVPTEWQVPAEPPQPAGD
jgi:Spy/CpxP family protein refolding chaperone